MRCEDATFGLVLLALSTVAAAAPPVPPPTSVPIATRGASRVASIEIAVTGAATTAGDLRLLFTPEGGETLEIRVSVPNAAGAEAIARELAAALTTAVAPDYAVRRTGPATLNVSCGKKRAPFLLKLAPEPIPGLAVRLD